MSKYFVSQRARADLAEAWLYVANDRPSAADRIFERMERHFALLASNPNLGEACPQLSRDLRQSIVGNYVVLYRPRAERVEIIRVIHGSRDVAAEFRRHWYS